MRWFRSHHGAPLDAKWVGIAKEAGVKRIDVVAVWWAMLDYASQQTDRGTVKGFSARDHAEFFEIDQAAVETIFATMRGRGLVTADDRIAKWEDRQPKREDSSVNERSRRYRAMQRNATHGNAPESEQNIAEKGASRPSHMRVTAAQRDAFFAEFWLLYPNKVAKRAADEAFRRALSRTKPETIIEAVRRYIATKPADQKWLNPASFLDQDRWLDQPAAQRTLVLAIPGGRHGHHRQAADGHDDPIGTERRAGIASAVARKLAD